MNKRVRQAALKLMLLQEEFTMAELDEAAALITNGEAESLIEFLSAKRSKRQGRCESKQNGIGVSRSVRELKESDPERYQLLAEFESMLREETILPTLEELRKVGVSASKEFQPAKSRKETISRLMAILGAMPIDTLREKLGKVIDDSKAAHRSDDSYRNLARYLISGSQQN